MYTCWFSTIAKTETPIQQKVNSTIIADHSGLFCIFAGALWGRRVLTASIFESVSMRSVGSLAPKSEDSNYKWQYSVCHGCLISDYVVIRAAAHRVNLFPRAAADIKTIQVAISEGCDAYLSTIQLRKALVCFAPAPSRQAMRN